ncbi:ribosome-associated translation inhibitor RaiA [Saccharophagus sp. K07]|jgi:ribosomal subunit interface protein|uniref:HPF/RaiA family ribosome-associated protein n=1 Tax=Saccharophagus sp. K07 TaxID=2283636 RepID=UPI0016526D67|nr:HPF/RaiA family ribosome-associated protein [Saccharophagus sp. K07]MBC6906967.1 ribosome-associated translation inhibitor RaiA [Saccharophagus sp. K07]
MRTDADVVFRDIDHSPALAHTINQKMAKLSRYSRDILRSRVVLDIPHNSKHKGKQFRASIELHLKGSPIAVSHDADSAHVAVRDAFLAAERKLKETCEIRFKR